MLILSLPSDSRSYNFGIVVYKISRGLELVGRALLCCTVDRSCLKWQQSGKVPVSEGSA